MVRYEVSRWKFVDNDVDERVDDIDDVDERVDDDELPAGEGMRCWGTPALRNVRTLLASTGCFFFHLLRLFWNHVFTWGVQRSKELCATPQRVPGTELLN